MPRFNPDDYGPVIASLLNEERLSPLGPGRPNTSREGELKRATVDAMFAHAGIAESSMAEACRSGLWLYHDFLDESHTISQDIPSATGSFWHGIMHRREPDFGNAKYWFRRVGDHTVFPFLASAARELAGQAKGLRKTRWLVSASAWEPFDFVDLCEESCDAYGPDHDLFRRV
jgi:hypothetical protein